MASRALAFCLRESLNSGFFERKKHSFQFDSGNPNAWHQSPQVTEVAGKVASKPDATFRANQSRLGNVASDDATLDATSGNVASFKG